MPTPGVKVEPNFCYSNILSTRSAQEQSRKNVACQLSGLEDVALNDFIKDDFSPDGDVASGYASRPDPAVRLRNLTIFDRPTFF